MSDAQKRHRADVRRRLRAARALGEFTSPKALAEHELLREHGITASRIIQTENGNRDAELWELHLIAQATGVPTSFFTDDVGRPARIEAKLDRLLESDPPR